MFFETGFLMPFDFKGFLCAHFTRPQQEYINWTVPEGGGGPQYPAMWPAKPGKAKQSQALYSTRGVYLLHCEMRDAEKLFKMRI